MLICDRCKTNKARFNPYVYDKSYDLCGTCYNELANLHKLQSLIEKEYMKGMSPSIMKVIIGKDKEVKL